MSRQLISRGSTGDVYAVSSGSKISALKILDSRKASRFLFSVETAYKREVKALSSVSHRNIVSLTSNEQISPSEFSISLTFCGGGSLFTQLYQRENAELTLKQKKKIFHDLINAITYLHSLPDPIIHGDIKSLNVLFMSPVHNPDVVPWVKLCDFGSSKFQSDPPLIGTVTVGTAQWMAPELVNGTEYGCPADVYGLSMVFYEISCRAVPYGKLEENVVLGKIVKGDRPELPLAVFEKACLADLIPILHRCWEEKPGLRPTMQELGQLMNAIFMSFGVPNPYMLSDWLHAAARTSSQAHAVMLPQTATTSGFFSPLNCFGQQEAINTAAADVSIALKKAVTAADQTFLVKPVNVPMPQALNSSRLLVVHNDAAAKAAAHLQLAFKNLKPYRTAGPDGLAISGIDDAAVLAVVSLSSDSRRRTYAEFIYSF